MEHGLIRHDFTSGRMTVTANAWLPDWSGKAVIFLPYDIDGYHASRYAAAHLIREGIGVVAAAPSRQEHDGWRFIHYAEMLIDSLAEEYGINSIGLLGKGPRAWDALVAAGRCSGEYPIERIVTWMSPGDYRDDGRNFLHIHEESLFSLRECGVRHLNVHDAGSDPTKGINEDPYRLMCSAGGELLFTSAAVPRKELMSEITSFFTGAATRSF